MSETYLNEGRPTFTAASALAQGQLCVLTAESKLTPLTASLLAGNLASALFVCVADAEAGTPAAAKIVGASSGTSLVKCGAGTLVPGAPLYAADAGAVTPTKPGSNVRVVGVYLGKSGTLSGAALVEMAPVFAVGSAS